MRSRTLLLVVPALSMLAVGLSAATDREPVQTFTGEDLDRMFGPAPAGPSELVDKTQPEDWRWVERFLDRQYSRIDADRRDALRNREADLDERRIERPATAGGTVLCVRGTGRFWPGAGWRTKGPGRPSGRAAYDRAMGRDVRPKTIGR